MAKCFVCGGDVPLFGNVIWCDGCLDELLASTETIEEFAKRKKSEREL